MDTFVADNDAKCMHALTSLIDGLYVGFARRGDEPIKATFY